MVNLERFLDIFQSKEGGKWRGDDQLAQAVTEALAEAHPAPPARPVVTVQRVDERQKNGTVRTTYEVVDRRLVKGQRIVASVATEAEARALAAVKAPIGGGAYTFEAVDTDEYFHDTDYELLASGDKYGVIRGCTITPDAANMTADLAVGAIWHSGSYVAVAAASDAYTIVSDGSNERWAALCISSAGSAVLVSGDAAASSSVEPAKPEIGDRVLAELYKVQAAQTIAANCEYQLDKRLLLSSTRVPYAKDATERTTTSVTNADLSTLSDLSISADLPITIRGIVRKTSGNASGAFLGLKINSTEVIDAAAGTSLFTANNQAEQGFFQFYIPPRITNYLRAVQYLARTNATAGGAAWDTSIDLGSSADAPTATVTSLTVTGAVANAANTLAIDEVIVTIG